MELRPYQNDAVTFLYERDRAMILAPVGAGKTAITLTAMAELRASGHVKRWLVVAPKRVCTDVWPVERKKWAPTLSMSVAIGSAAQRKAAFAAPTDVVVFNYDNLDKLPGGDFDGVVFDELTRLKNPSGKRFKALLKVLDRFRVRWGLTGSFTSNGLEDVFGQCKVINEHLLGRAKGAFLQQYFVCINRDFGEWMPRKGALEQVMTRIRPATFVLEPGVYKDRLPPCHVVEMRCDLPDRAPYEQMKRDFVVEMKGKEITALSAAAVTTKLQQMAGGWVYDTITQAHDTAGVFRSYKYPHWFSTHRFDLLDEVLEGNQRANTLIVYNFIEELAELKRRYPGRLWTLDDGADVIERWNAGKIPLLAVHPKSAGHGLNLQMSCNHMVFLSLPWSLELYEQVVGRIHRGGQTRDVWVYVLLTNQTIDERIWAALADKRAVSEVALEELKG
ncbi:MAG: DEAD/DEAH box helicase [Armatimonadia bacterium]